MDGIDGITAMETILLMIGVSAVYTVSPGLPERLPLETSILAAAALGFYAFNRMPARLFMGDTGSVPLGFLTFYLLLTLAYGGAWKAALILPAYYLLDSGWTLFRRILKREKVWQAHSQHAYQKAVRAGSSHHEVVCKITLLNMVLISLALYATLQPAHGIAALFFAYLLTAVFLRHLSHAIAAR